MPIPHAHLCVAEEVQQFLHLSFLRFSLVYPRARSVTMFAPLCLPSLQFVLFPFSFPSTVTAETDTLYTEDWTRNSGKKDTSQSFGCPPCSWLYTSAWLYSECIDVSGAPEHEFRHNQPITRRSVAYCPHLRTRLSSR